MTHAKHQIRSYDKLQTVVCLMYVWYNQLLNLPHVFMVVQDESAEEIERILNEELIKRFEDYNIFAIINQSAMLCVISQNQNKNPWKPFGELSPICVDLHSSMTILIHSLDFYSVHSYEWFTLQMKINGFHTLNQLSWWKNMYFDQTTC